jgi:lysophospholipase L1-like esterase
MRRRALTLTLVLPTLLATLAVAAPASAHTTPEQGRVAPGAPPLYLALGDSVGFGIGAANPFTGGYVARLHSSLREGLPCPPQPDCAELGVRNLSVPGAVSRTLIAYQLPFALLELARRNWDGSVANNVEVVTIDIGGNDVFGALESCRAGLPPSDACVHDVRARLAAFERNFATTLRALRFAAGPRTRIVAMTYYNPLPACDLAPLAPLGEAVLEGDPALAEQGLNDLIRSISAANRVDVAETHGLLGPPELVGGEDCLHPDDAGHERIAAAFAAALDLPAR